MIRISWLGATLAWLAVAHSQVALADACRVRVATFNASLSRSDAGDLANELGREGSAQPAAIAEILQRVRPEIVLLNEFDHDASGDAARLFQENYLSVSQGGAEPIEYPFVFFAPSNTGIPSGADLDNDGSVGGPDDAFGFGFFEGQFGMLVLSMHEIDLPRVRTFQRFLWKDLPGALLPDNPSTPEPEDWYSDAELEIFRLSSKSHWDVPVLVGGETLHVLVSHPTPPVFDGAEDRNGRRNHDEIAFWARYVTPGDGDTLYDDSGVFGGLPEGEPFVICGDLNADPLDGDSTGDAAAQLLEHPLVQDVVRPRSRGGAEQAALQGRANASHSGDPQFDTADFADGSPGNLRVDYVLPGAALSIANAGVFWPLAADARFSLVGTFPFPSSDHRLVWIDIDMGDAEGELRVATGDVTASTVIVSARGLGPGNARFEIRRAEGDALAGRGTLFVSGAGASPSLSFSGLEPGSEYIARVVDAVGARGEARFRTLRLPGSSRRLRFGVSGDSRGELAPFPALRGADARGLEFFVYLGDTIYADVASPRVPTRQALELEQFRAKQNEVLASRFGLSVLGDLRSAVTSFATIDDHEVTDDFAGAASPQSDPRFLPSEAEFIHDTSLFRNGLEAFQEAYPCARETYGDTGDARTAGKAKLYRYRQAGREAAFFLLDSRSFRDEGLRAVSNPADPAEVDAFLESSFDPDRTLLGRAQIEELKRDLLDAERRGIVWKFVFVPEPIQNLGVVSAPDRFEGYAAERAELLAFVRHEAISDVVFVAADIHGTLVNNLSYQAEPGGPQIPVDAFEVTTGPIAYDAPFGPTVIELAVGLGILPESTLEFYESLDRGDRDLLVEELVNQLVVSLGYDPLGLDGWERETELMSGGWSVLNIYGWTEFEIDPETFDLLVTTWGIEPYDEDDLDAAPCEVIAREPEIVQSFRVASRSAPRPYPDGCELGFGDVPSGAVAIGLGESASLSIDVTLTCGGDVSGVEAWSYGVAAVGGSIAAIRFEGVEAALHADPAQAFVLQELVEGGATAVVVLSNAGSAMLPPSSRTQIARLDLEIPADDPLLDGVELEFRELTSNAGEPVVIETVTDGIRATPRVSAARVPVTIAREFIRGDTQGDGSLSIGDAVRIFGVLFRGNPVALGCDDAGDVDDSGSLGITDGIALLNHLFLGAGPPAAPFPGCGSDPTEDALGCDATVVCDA